MSKLGKLEKVDLRDIWKGEAQDFTPWLAKDDNLSLLGDTLDMELELEGQEKSVGPFRADIVCRDTADNSLVLIENQLAKTDHQHVGQLITYAAGLDAVTIIWIAAEFADEHRAAMDWLNEISGDKFRFFGLEIEFWKIGNSPIAPKFNIVAKPNDWSRSIRQNSKGEISERGKAYLSFWQDLRGKLEKMNSKVGPRKPSPESFTDFSIGKTGFLLSGFLIKRKKHLRVGLVTNGPSSNNHFNLLKRDRTDIENSIGAELDWTTEKPNGNECRIYFI